MTPAPTSQCTASPSSRRHGHTTSSSSSPRTWLIFVKLGRPDVCWGLSQLGGLESPHAKSSTHDWPLFRLYSPDPQSREHAARRVLLSTANDQKPDKDTLQLKSRRCAVPRGTEVRARGPQPRIIACATRRGRGARCGANAPTGSIDDARYGESVMRAVNTARSPAAPGSLSRARERAANYVWAGPRVARFSLTPAALRGGPRRFKGVRACN